MMEILKTGLALTQMLIAQWHIQTVKTHQLPMVELIPLPDTQLIL